MMRYKFSGNPVDFRTTNRFPKTLQSFPSTHNGHNEHHGHYDHNSHTRDNRG